MPIKLQYCICLKLESSYSLYIKDYKIVLRETHL